MLKVKVKLKDKRFQIPVPYVFLNLISTIITSKSLNHFINKAIEKDGEKFTLPQIERRDLKPLLESLPMYNGLTLIETKLKDGTEVSVKL